MEFKYDAQADAIYIYLSDKPYAYGKDLDDERRIDYAFPILNILLPHAVS